MFLRQFQHLLPNARAWLINSNKQLRQFFDALSGINADVKKYYDDIYLDIFPQTTRQIDEWESHFGLPDTLLNQQERRDRLAAKWQEQGGQSLQYIQDTLQANGFDVFVHNWWEPGTEPPVNVKACVTPRNPQLVLRPDSLTAKLMIECGEPLAQCGEPDAQCGNSLNPIGYPLVNRLFDTEPDYFVQCGEPGAQCGEPLALCGNFITFKLFPKKYVVPIDPAKWPYFAYVGAETYPEIASVASNRKDEFEDLLLKLGPSRLWWGVLVQYV